MEWSDRFDQHILAKKQYESRARDEKTPLD